MLITSMIVKVLPAKAMEVARLLGRIPKLAIYGVHDRENIIVVAETKNDSELKNLFQQITDKSADVLDILTTDEISDGATSRSKTGLAESPETTAPEPQRKGEIARRKSRPGLEFSLFEKKPCYSV